MPSDGANNLSDVRDPVLTVVCEPCGRRERYEVERLMRQYGWDAKLTDLLPALVMDFLRGARSVSMTGARRCSTGGGDRGPSVSCWARRSAWTRRGREGKA